MIKFVLSCFAAVILISVSVSAQNFKQEISLSGLGDQSAAARPFGIAYNPATQLVYVSIAGSFGANNNAVAVIDPSSDTVVATMLVGLYPEDIAFDPTTGSGAVTNSTSGSISFFNMSHMVTSTLQLPDPFGIGSCYPFGITHANGYYYVGTVDGSGEVYAIDAATNTLAPSMGFSTNYRSLGRMTSTANGSLLATTTTYNATWSGATGGVFAYDLASASTGRQTNFLSQDNLGTYPSASDFTFANGNTFMAGIDFDGLLYVVNEDGTPARAIPTNGHSGYGLATSEEGSLIAMCDLSAGAVVFFDAINEEYVSEVGFSGMANDAVFANGKLYVTDQSSERVMVYDQLPTFTDRNEHDGTLILNNSAPSLGDAVGVTVLGNVGHPVWLVGASTAGATTFNGINFAIGPNLFSYGTDNTTFYMGRNVPNNLALSGRRFYMQGAVSDGSVIRTTQPAVLIIQ